MENSTAYTYVHDVFYLWLNGLERRFIQYFCNITSFPKKYDKQFSIDFYVINDVAGSVIKTLYKLRIQLV